ncbi:TPA: glucosaminidase domain-containing protein [Staphylococcus aureus]|uniref:Bifunctional autolysin n=1 Tax=Staphylococcus aureus TaxID=1280 RepID=A0A142G9F0_STAAU|nr:bifunctional autolysin [Staphylococcus aureus]AMR00586.1 N-acetylmuramoyl-L-alanine amidase [Staphylococcus aureus]AMR00588.1 N-acetylmuramoyl-L-alanine amidase [Staphylococcus aureus]QHK67001.1 mannosyl-glycoprotein endo-beta-N-acetylglucosamidase [Staphylococcus aureus]HCV8580278.1 glucosaminidase domain-containing protein [Staphylococcus aureus]HCV9431080.1 glucosaminidase domain-containing protein [Staphylococcus aureus]
MAKKFNYKLPSMVALTLVGSAVTAHQVQAAETTQDQTTNKNVLDSNKVKATTEQAKAEVKNPTQNISGTQVYQDPAIVQPKTANNKTGNAQVSQKVDTAQVNGDTRANQSATTNNTKPVAKSTSTTAPKTNTNVTNAGYSLVDDEDDNSENQINPELIKSAAKPAALETQYKAAAPKAKTEATPKVTTFSASAQPRSVAATPKTSLPKYKPQVNSSINDYIRKNNLKAPKIEEDYTSYFPKYAYRNGVGRPEGIVVHDTANDRSTINGEISYMKNNYQNAFVHAFVDGDRIIETAPTDYLSWGVGAVGNPRFINVEIVHTHDYASFARSMNNYADYAATQLQYYGLKPDSAEYDGNGTVWTHYAVSKYLGGTDHADPHGYLRSHNYSYDQLYDLINEKYLIKMGKVAPWGTQSTTTPTTPSKPSTPSTPSTGKLTVAANNGVAQIKPTNSGLYTTVYDKTGKATNEVQKTFAVSKTATLGNQKFYLVQDYNSGNKFGWVKEGDVVYNTSKSPVNVNQSYSIKPGTKLYTVPWGTSKQVAGSVSGSGNQTFKASKQQQIDKSIYLYGSVNGKSGWVSKAYLVDTAKPTPTPKPSTPTTNNKLTVSSLNGVAQINAKNNGLFTTVYDKTGKPTKEVQKTFAVTKEASLGGNKFYLVKDYNSPTLIGWVKQGDVIYNNAKSPVNVMQTYTVKPGTKLYSVPWGTYKQEAGAVSGTGNQTFKATKQQQIDKSIYLYGTVNGKSGWVSKAYLAEPVAPKKAVAQPKTAVKAYAVTKPQTTQTVSKIAQVKPNNTGIRASVYEKTAKNGAKYADRTFYVTKERAHGNETYVLLNNTSHNIPLGWFNVKDLNVQNLGKEVKTTQKYTVNKSNNGLSMVPWGTKNQVILTGNNIAQGTFNATKQVSVGKDVYLYGTINNRTGWVNAKDLTAPTAVKPTTSAAKDYNYTYVIKNGNGYYYVTPNSDTAKYSLKAFNEQPFAVVKEQVINGQTWYYGKLSNGKLAWIKSTDLAKELIKYNQTGMTLNQVAQIQAGLQYKPQVQRVPGKWTDANFNDVKHAMDTKRLAQDPALKYQFLRLDQPQNISIDKINQFLKGKGVLENQGAAFNKAAQMYGINEVYLISHALLETGNGTSQLAKGADVVNNKVVTNSNTKYHNVFGIAAYDNDPLREGIKYAKQAGWDTVSKAIVGGAKFIGNSYVKAGQNTLYKMRWNPAHPGTHQYATDVDWANINAKIIKGYYDKIGEVGKYFDIPQYK